MQYLLSTATMSKYNLIPFKIPVDLHALKTTIRGPKSLAFAVLKLFVIITVELPLIFKSLRHMQSHFVSFHIKEPERSLLSILTLHKYHLMLVLFQWVSTPPFPPHMEGLLKFHNRGNWGSILLIVGILGHSPAGIVLTQPSWDSESARNHM